MNIKEFENKVDEFIKSFTKEEMLKILKESGFEVIENEKQGKWKPQYGERYWFRDDAGYFRTDELDPGDIMEWRLTYVPVFPTKEECEKYWEFRDAVEDKSSEFSKEEWRSTKIRKYVIYYDFGQDEFVVYRTTNTKYFGEIYFRNEESAQYIIDNYKEELLKYWL